MFKFSVCFAILIGSTHCASILQTSFQLVEKKIQTNTNIHTVINLVTPEKTAECANYCMMQGSSFSEYECGAFFVEAATNCHLIPKSWKDETTDHATIDYFKKTD